MKWRVLLAEAANVALATFTEYNERLSVFRQARQYADQVGKPLLNYGCKDIEPYVSLSDINVDIIPRNVKNFMLAPPDSMRLPFKVGEVVTFCSHVLEHVQNPNALLKELNRISDKLFIVLPKWWNLSAWINPNHKRMYIANYVVETPQCLSGPLLLGINLLSIL
jgi:hypothetical protein